MKWKLRKTHIIVPELVHNVRGVKQVRCRDNALVLDGGPGEQPTHARTPSFVLLQTVWRVLSDMHYAPLSIFEAAHVPLHMTRSWVLCDSPILNGEDEHIEAASS